MKRNRLLGWLTAGALSVGLIWTPAAAFTDTAGHWAEPAINKWSQEYGIIQGYEDGTFRPDNSITRGAFAGILDRFMQFQSVSPAGTFSDLTGSYWEEQILKLNAAGVYLGNNGKALASDSITRQQAVAMIARAFDITTSTTALPYTDADQISEYAIPAVAEMTARGWLNDSTDGRFRPTDPITRAEIVHIFGNMIQTLIQTPGTYSQDVNGTLMISSAEGATLDHMTISGDLILAPGVVGIVTLNNVTIGGTLRNFSQVEPTITDTTPTEKPTDPSPNEPNTGGMLPSEVYTPGTTTGQTLSYGGQQIPIYQNRASENQTIDWEAVKADGVDFAMVRIGLRGYSTGGISADAFYAQNIEGAMAAGIETGVYFFAQAITVEEAIEEADFVISLLRDHEINGPVAYDWEMHDSTYRVYGTTPEMATACAIAFCQRIAEAGYTPMIYAGQYVSYIKYDQGAIAPYLCWYPEYKTTSSEKLYPSFYYQMDYWQFSSSCTVDGIGGRVDGNIQFIPR